MRRKSGRSEVVERAVSSATLWDDLESDPLLEQSEIIVIERGYFKRLFGAMYEHLGSLILLNLAVSVQVLAGTAVGLLVGTIVPGGSGVKLFGAAIVTILFAAPAFAGLFYFVRNMCDDDERTMLSDYWLGMRVFARRSWILLAVQAATGGLLVLNFRFYSTVHSFVGTLVMLLILIITAIWAMAGSYAWPLLVRKMDWKLLARNSFFLALAAPASTLLMVVLLTAITSVLVVLTRGITAVVFLFSVWAVTENVSMMRLVRIFRARQEKFVEQSGVAHPG
jgi:uncharacterized membrane protein YesL